MNSFTSLKGLKFLLNSFKNVLRNENIKFYSKNSKKKKIFQVNFNYL